MEPMQAVINALTGLGVPGIIIAALLLWVFRLHDRLEKAHQARIDDAKAFTERSLKLQEGVHRSVDKLESLTELLMRRSTHDE